jgi:hypothetical protein
MTIQDTLIKLNKHMTDEQVARHVGATQSVIWRVRTGVIKQTRYERGVAIKKLALTFGIHEQD